MIKIEIITPERIVHQLEGSEVIVPTKDGILGIRRGHLPLVAPLAIGEIIVKTDKGSSEHFAVAGGFLEILPEQVRILADSAERAEELNETIIQEAIARAQKVKEEAKSSPEVDNATAIIAANLARLKVVRRKHSSRSHTQIEGSE